MTLQDLMVRYRAKYRITQQELARQCGVCVMTINAVENGTQKPSRVTEQKIRLVVEEKGD